MVEEAKVAGHNPKGRDQDEDEGVRSLTFYCRKGEIVVCPPGILSTLRQKLENTKVFARQSSSTCILVHWGRL